MLASFSEYCRSFLQKIRIYLMQAIFLSFCLSMKSLSFLYKSCNFVASQLHTASGGVLKSSKLVQISGRIFQETTFFVLLWLYKWLWFNLKKAWIWQFKKPESFIWTTKETKKYLIANQLFCPGLCSFQRLIDKKWDAAENLTFNRKSTIF